MKSEPLADREAPQRVDPLNGAIQVRILGGSLFEQRVASVAAESSWRRLSHCVPRAWEGSSMLVLSRKENEEIVLTLVDGSTIVVRAVEIRGDRVRLGIEAARDIGVHRREIHDRMIAERMEEIAQVA